MPRIHVVIPAFNCQDFITEALQSIIDQSDGDFVVTVVDDCSTDATAETANALGDRRIRVVSNTANMGLPDSINAHIADFDCDYIARMDADDIAQPRRFEIQVQHLQDNPEIDVLGSSAFKMNHKGQIIGAFAESGYPPSHDEIKGNLMFGSPLLHPSVMFRASSVANLGPIYRRTAVPAADYDAWITLALRGLVFRNLPDKLMNYRIHENQISEARGSAQKQIGDALRYFVLKQVVPELSRSHWATHDAIRTRKWKDLKFDDVMDWFSYLLTSNRTSGWTSDEAMKAVLGRRLHVLLTRNKNWSTSKRAAYSKQAQEVFG